VANRIIQRRSFGHYMTLRYQAVNILLNSYLEILQRKDSHISLLIIKWFT